ncbi:hypothetical protein B0H11DRAFT_1904905 [Mycena galericulata]|nr:hypothetical protein B0H11DRAFT_1904905 [Mycena galericulata]
MDTDTACSNLSLELEGSAKLGPFITTGLNFGVDILNEKWTVAAGVEVEASLPGGVSAVMKTGNTVDTQFQRIRPAKAEKMDRLVPDVPLPMLAPVYSNQFPKPDNNIYAAPPLEAYDAKYVLNRCFQGSTAVFNTNATAGTYDNRVFIFDSRHMDDALGVAPLRIAPSNEVPEHSTVVWVFYLVLLPRVTDTNVGALRSEIGTDGKPFVGAVTIASKDFKPYYYPFICIYAEGNKAAIVFLAKDPVDGPKFQGRAYLYTTCSFTPFSIT